MEIFLGLFVLFLVIGIIIILILGIIYGAGLILLIVGIVGWIRAKKAGVKKVYPKVLILISLPLLIVPTIYVGIPVVESLLRIGTN